MEAREGALRPDAAQVAPNVSDYVHLLDVDALMDLAVKHDVLIRVLSRPGRYVLDGVPVVEIWPAAAVDARILQKVRDAFLIGRTRTSQQDIEFALYQLVEVAVRCRRA